MSKLNFEKKKIVDSRKESRVPSQNRENDHFGMSDGILFFVQKKVNHSVFWGEIYWRIPRCCNYSNIIPGSQTKVEKTEFFIVFSTFDGDPEIIM